MSQSAPRTRGPRRHRAGRASGAHKELCAAPGKARRPRLAAPRLQAGAQGRRGPASPTPGSAGPEAEHRRPPLYFHRGCQVLHLQVTRPWGATRADSARGHWGERAGGAQRGRNDVNGCLSLSACPGPGFWSPSKAGITRTPFHRESQRGSGAQPTAESPEEFACEPGPRDPRPTGRSA